MLVTRAQPALRTRCSAKGASLVPAPAVPRPLVACSANSRPETAQTDSWMTKPVQALGTLALAVAVATSSPAAMAAEFQAPENTVYFGNGCFWGRQFDFVNTEKSLGRKSDQISALVGYAGGTQVGPDGKVCYYTSDPRTVYEKLGHAEVVQLQLTPNQSETEFRRFADTYFKQFRRLADGRMQRLDPQDQGPGYRNVIGLPGGVNSPLFKVLQDANVNNMELRAGSGNQYVDADGKTRVATEADLVNVVWVVDSNQLPFYQAERYHQFHNGIGKFFPLDYTWDLKNQKNPRGTGCPEFPF